MTKVIPIGFLGCGNVGSGVWKLLEGFGAEIEHRAGLRFEIRKVLVRDVHKQREIQFPDGVLTDDPVLPPVSGKRQLDRDNLRKATALLDEAGCPSPIRAIRAGDFGHRGQLPSSS